MADNLSRLLPLSQAHFYILLSLSAGDKHGYAIMQEVASLSEATYKVGPATLYENLSKLLALGAISEAPGATGDDARRRYYRLTTSGKRLLKLELARLDRLLEGAAARTRRPKENPA